MKLKDVCEERRERIPAESIDCDHYVTTDNMLKDLGGVVRAKAVPPGTSLVKYEAGDVLLSNIRPYLKKVWLADRDGGCSNDVIVLSVRREEVLPEYLRQVLSQDAYFAYVMRNVTGAKMPRGKREWIMDFRFPLPPLEEQRAIVERVEKRMGCVSRMEAGFRRMGEWAGKRRQAVLAEAFGKSGGGEDGEAEGNEEEEFCPKRPRRSAALPAMCNPGASQASGEGRALSRPPSHGACNSVKGEECGRAARAPTGWPRVMLGDVCEIMYGYTAQSTPIYEEGAFHYLRITDIQNDRIDWTKVPFCTCDSSPRYLLKPGDIVFARTGATTGKSFLLPETFPPSVFASYLIRVQVLDPKILLPEFLRFFFDTATYWKSIQSGMIGAAQGGFNSAKLASLKIPLPPIQIQKQLITAMRSARTSCERVSNLSRAGAAWCAKLRRAVLEEAFS